MSTRTPLTGVVSNPAAARGSVAELFRSALDLPAKALERTFDRLSLWQERTRERHQLRMLDDHMLQDVGLSRADVESEARKPFWLS